MSRRIVDLRVRYNPTDWVWEIQAAIPSDDETTITWHRTSYTYHTDGHAEQGRRILAERHGLPTRRTGH